MYLSWDFSPKCISGERWNRPFGLVLQKCQVSTEDMLGRAYVDTLKTKFYFCELVLAVPFLNHNDFSEKVSLEQKFLQERQSCKTCLAFGTRSGELCLLC